jgi:hypothetical protein
VNEGGVPHDDLFPIELLTLHAQESLLSEFCGRHPCVSEVARIADADLLRLPGFGPSTVKKVRSMIQGGIKSSSAVAGLSNADLLSEHIRLLAELTNLRDEFNRQEHLLQGQLHAVRREVRVRGLPST